jgi:predicted ester cyclase
MSSTTRTTIEAYLQVLTAPQGGRFADFFTDDVTFELIGTGQPVQGREQVEAAIQYAHQEAFAARPEQRAMVVDSANNRAAVEFDFVGRHIGEFAGIAATGREVRVPYSVHYDLQESHISALRVYGLADGLVSALS